MCPCCIVDIQKVVGDVDNVRNIKLYNIFKGLVARCHSFVYFYNFRSYAHSFNKFVHHIGSHSLNSTLVFFIAVRSVEGPLSWGAEPRIELETAVQQPDALPYVLRGTLLSYAAPFCIYFLKYNCFPSHER